MVHLRVARGPLVFGRGRPWLFGAWALVFWCAGCVPFLLMLMLMLGILCACVFNMWCVALRVRDTSRVGGLFALSRRLG